LELKNRKTLSIVCGGESNYTIKEELEFTSHKTVRNEMEIFKLRRSSFERENI